MRIGIKLKILLSLIALMAMFQIKAQEFKSSFKKYGLKEGLSQARVYKILEDRKGFIWIATQDGLNRFDGNEFKVFKKDPKNSASLADNEVLDFVEDKKGNIWIASVSGSICKYDPLTEQFKKYYFSPNSNKFKFNPSEARKIYVDHKNNIWVSHPKGLDIYDESKDTFKKVTVEQNVIDFGVFSMAGDKNDNLWLSTYNGLQLLDTKNYKIIKSISHDPFNPNSIDPGFVLKIIPDNDKYIWVLQPNYLISRINLKTGVVKKYFNDPKKNNPHPRDLIISKSGDIWLATEFNGIGKLDRETGSFTPPYKESKVFQDLSNYPNVSLMEDSKGSIWVSSWGQGVIHYDRNANQFGYKPNVSDSPYDSRTNSFSKIFEDNNGNLWIGNLREGLVMLDSKTNAKNTFDTIKKYLNIDKILVQEIIQDQNQNIWIGTRSNGIIKINPLTFEFKVYFNSLDSTGNMGANSFHLIEETHDGKLWFANIGSIIFFDPVSESTKIYRYVPSSKKSLPGSFATQIYEDPYYKVWISFFNGGFYNFNRTTEVFDAINLKQEMPSPSNSTYISKLLHGKKDILWIGTTKGLNKYNTKTKNVRRYTIENGLANNTIQDILDDDEGNLWISTINGISKFNPDTEVFNNYYDQDGLQQSEFNIHSGHKSKKSDLFYFGGSLGLNYFNPKEIKKNNHIPPVVIADFKKYNSEKGFINEPGLNYKDQIELGYNEKDFSLKVAALDFTNPPYNMFAYKLEGYNTNWVEIGTRREITFTNLSPGSYNLRVKGANNDGVWNEEGKSLQINILPAWWGTWWAYTFYALLLLGLLYAAYQYRINQLEAIRFKELDEAKRTMYTNITHEFRTPLTVISGINKEIKEKSEGKFKDQFDLIERNSKNMLYLVNQLLELRKLEIGKTQFDYIQSNIIPYLKYIAESFKTYAKTKDISLHFVSIADEIYMDYDPDKLLMILSNLLSNAIKYSKPGGDVYLQVEELENKLQIKVVDSGKGIHEQELPHIFDRFYKVQHKEDDNIDGVGIGLAVTKELTELLKGEIYANSQIGQGSIFTLELPIENKAPMSKSTTKTLEKPTDTRKASVTPKALWSKTQTKEEALQLLIIEDNTDIVQYLKNCLKEHWNLAFAADGLKGIEKAIEEVPDIILCDLMMPNANGYKVLEVLKNDPSTSHIPIVILTAKADEESRLEAYKKGADAYLLKPFNKEELQIILQKLTEQRRLLQERYKTQASLRFADGVEIHKEDTFIQKLEELVLSEDSKSSYSIKSLCEDLGMSRTQLHNKIKALTGKSTSIFVRSLRLQKGKYLLEHTGKAISEIAYDVGFNNPSYFTKSFTEEFGIPPSSLRK